MIAEALLIILVILVISNIIYYVLEKTNPVNADLEDFFAGSRKISKEDLKKIKEYNKKPTNNTDNVDVDYIEAEDSDKPKNMDNKVLALFKKIFPTGQELELDGKKSISSYGKTPNTHKIAIFETLMEGVPAENLKGNKKRINNMSSYNIINSERDGYKSVD